jgi:hypothetical protein
MSASLAIHSNNVGVDLFAMGLLEQAAGKFQSAVEEMSDLVMNSDAPSNWSEALASSTGVKYQPPINGWSNPCQTRITFGSERIRVFQRAAYLNPSFSPSAISTYTAVTLLNLGLCYHMIALRDNSPSHLQHASKIYDAVMGSVDACRPFDDAHFLLLHLALYTNCGHILSHQFNNRRGAIECFETCCSLLTWLHVRNAALLVLDETEVEELMCNMGSLLEHKVWDITLSMGAAAA